MGWGCVQTEGPTKPYSLLWGAPGRPGFGNPAVEVSSHRTRSARSYALCAQGPISGLLLLTSLTRLFSPTRPLPPSHPHPKSTTTRWNPKSPDWLTPLCDSGLPVPSPAQRCVSRAADAVDRHHRRRCCLCGLLHRLGRPGRVEIHRFLRFFVRITSPSLPDCY